MSAFIFPDESQHQDHRESRKLAELLMDHGQLMTFKKHEFIFRIVEASSNIYYMQSGLVKISQSAQEGRDMTIFLRHEGELFGAAEALAGAGRQRYASCMVDSEVLMMPSSEFLSRVKADPELLYALTVTQAKRLLNVQQSMESLVSKPVSWRLAHLLTRLGRLQGEQLHVALSLSHEELSYVIGCSRQTVTEILNSWRERGLIAYDRKKLVVYQAAAMEHLKPDGDH